MPAGAKKQDFAFYERASAFALTAVVFFTGMVLFTRMELVRETSAAVQHAGMVAAGGHAVPAKARVRILANFTWRSKGVDKFGLPVGSSLAFSNVRQGFETGGDLKAAILQLRGQVQKVGHPACMPYSGWQVCAAPGKNKAIHGVVMMPMGVRVMSLVLYALTVLTAGILLLFGLFKGIQRGGIWPDVALVFVATVVFAALCGHYAGAWLGMLARGFSYSGHTAVQGAGMLLGPALFAGILHLILARHVMEFMQELRRKPFVYAAISPAMIGMVVLVFIPFFMGVYIAFLDNNYNFVGLANFKEVLFPSAHSDTNFYFTFGVTVMWTALNVSLHVTIGLLLALILSDHRLREKAIYRVLLVVPWAVPSYITALIWKWMFNTQYGPINAFIKVLGLPAVDWLGRSFWTNFTANLVTNTWLGFPFMMVVSLGALQSIPAQLYEAAEIDGANRWQRFRHVTLPLIKPALFPAIILGTIWTFNMFNVVYLVSGGAPDNKTNILITEAYRAFRVLKNYGLAAAYSLLIFLILLGYSLITNKLTKGTEDIYA